MLHLLNVVFLLGHNKLHLTTNIWISIVIVIVSVVQEIAKDIYLHDQM